jgi:nitrogen fixation protein NifU and related proteins
MLFLRRYRFFLKTATLTKLAHPTEGSNLPEDATSIFHEGVNMDDNRKEFLLALGYAPKAVDVLEKELHLGTLPDATVQVRHQAGCGDVLELWLRIDKDIIADAAFQYAGCAGLQASASSLTDLIIGLHVDDADRLDVGDIISFLVAIPRNKYECAEASRDTLRKAIREYREGKGQM